MIDSEVKSHDSRRRAYRTDTHLVFERRKMRRESIQWQRIFPPIPFHPETPDWFLDQLLMDWTDRAQLECIPSEWLCGNAVNLFAAAPPLIPESPLQHGLFGHA